MSNVMKHLYLELYSLLKLKCDMITNDEWVSAWPNAKRIDAKIEFYHDKIKEMEG